MNALPSIGAGMIHEREMAVNCVTPNVIPYGGNSGFGGAKMGTSSPIMGATMESGRECVLTPIGAGLRRLEKIKLVDGVGLEPAATGLNVMLELVHSDTGPSLVTEAARVRACSIFRW